MSSMPNQESKVSQTFINKQSLANVVYYKIAGFTLIFFGFFGAMQVYDWPLLKYWGVKGHIDFADLNSVLGSADCFRTIGFAIYDYPIGHECAYNYGSWLMRTISALGLKESFTSVIGWLFILGISYLLAFVIARVKIKLIDVVFGFMIFVSPPIMLLLERGNFDILIIFLVIFAAKLASLQRITLSIIVIFASFLYKFYTVGLVLLMTLFTRTLFAFIFWLFALGVGIVQVALDFQRGPGFINTERISFGGPIFGIYLKYVGLDLSYLFSLIIGILLLFIGVWLFGLKKFPTNQYFTDLKLVNPEKNFSYFIFLFFIAVHTSCYVLGMNFDYRLILVAVANFILITQFDLSPKTRLTLRIMTVLIMWTSFNSGFFQPVGDFLIGILTIHYVFLIWWFFLSSDRGNAIYRSLLRLFRKSVL